MAQVNIRMDDELINDTENDKAPSDQTDKAAMLDSLVGIIPDAGQTRETIRDERLEERYGFAD